MILKNHERGHANRSLIILLIGISLILFPFIEDADMMNWGYASIYFGGFLMLCALISFYIFNSRAKVMKKIIEKEEVLAIWTSSKEQMSKIDEEAYSNAKMSKQASLVFAGIFTLIGVIMYFIDSEENGIFTMVMIIIGLIIALAGKLGSAYTLKKINKNNNETVIVYQGVYFRGDLYNWNGFISKLECVMVDPLDNKSFLMIFKHFDARVAYRRRYLLQIPIPKGMDHEAEKIIDLYGLYPSSEIMEYVKEIEREN